MRACKLVVCVGAALGLAVASPMIPVGLFTPTPAAWAASVSASPSYAEAVKYTVKAGDSLGAIADSFGVKAQAIQGANGLADPNAIQAGMVLTIPGSSPPPTPTPASTQYTVKPGDSLLSIAQALDVSAAAIQQANGLADPNAIKAGQVLTIPSGSQGASSPTAAQLTATPTPTPEPKYTVKVGDTLSGIAATLGVSAQAIQNANGLADPNAVEVGQVLTIPGASVAAAPNPTPAPTQASRSPSPTPAAAPAPQPTPSARPASTAPASDLRLFPQTGYRIDNDTFWDYFNKRGGVRTFGYPVSHTFTFLGFTTQFFQREILQLAPDGSPRTMNLLDPGLMPYTKINGSTFPAPDPQMAGSAPQPGSPNYASDVLAFVQNNAPDQLGGMPVNFYKTFMDTVTMRDAYPNGGGDPNLLPLLNLEIWGVPTSKPMVDPNDHNFIYQRFQRGIMHYDATTGATQGLLLGDYLKAIITGVNLPTDLADEAQGSGFFVQYNLNSPDGLARPADLPGTNMAGAFGNITPPAALLEKALGHSGLVVLDPGHGGTEIGAGSAFPGLSVLAEKNLNLKVALRTAELLRQAGRPVLLTRTTDAHVNNPQRDVTGDGKIDLDDDLEARVDIANNAGAQLFLSIHFNGNADRSLNGATAYYDNARPFSDKSRQFAQMVLDNLLSATRAAGFDLASRGVMTDESAVGMGNHFYILGPVGDDKPRATQMVGALAEGGFVTNAHDAAFLAQDKFLNAVAQGYANAIIQWFGSVGR